MKELRVYRTASFLTFATARATAFKPSTFVLEEITQVYVHCDSVEQKVCVNCGFKTSGFARQRL